MSLSVTIPASARRRCSRCKAPILRLQTRHAITYEINPEPSEHGAAALFHPLAGPGGPQLAVLLVRPAEASDLVRYTSHSTTCPAQRGATSRNPWRGGTPVRDLFDFSHCRVDGCPRRCRVEDLLCDRHYAALTRWERVRLAGAWNGGQPGRNFYEVLREFIGIAARRRPVPPPSNTNAPEGATA